MRTAPLLFVLLAGCGEDDPTPPTTPSAPQGLVAIAVEPRNATMVIDGDTPARGTYRAVGTFRDGRVTDVTEHVTFRVDDGSLGHFDGAELTSGTRRGGVTSVLAYAGEVVGSTGLSLVIRKRVTDPSAPADAPARLGGPEDPGRAPRVVYPEDGVLLPPNLGRLEVHFVPSAGQTLYEVSLDGALSDIKVYTGCTQPTAGGCIYELDRQTWQWLADTERGTSVVRVTVRGTDGVTIGTSQPVALEISQGAIQGGLYYWTTSNGTGIMRFDFASETQTQAEKFVGTELTGGKCIGCHALSRDGSKLVAEAGGQHDGRLLLMSVASRQPMVPFGSTAKSTFESWDPTGDRFVGVYGDQGASDYNLLIFDGETARLRGTIGATGSAQNPATHPDWSPDGKRIAFVRVGKPNTLQRFGAGSIQMVTLSGGTWGEPVEVVPRQDGRNRYYPAFAPDGGSLVFNESRCPPGAILSVECNADTDPSARLYAVLPEAGAKPIDLQRANGGPGSLTNSFPRWSPFVFQRSAGPASETTTRLMWLTFSSSRKYGLRPPPPPGVGGGQSQSGTLIWMAAVDPDRITSGSDGSYPAFALPFQDLTTSNHIAQWTTQIVPPIP